NWSTGVIPILHEDVIIDAPGSYLVTVNGSTPYLSSLLIQPQTGSQIELKITGGTFSVEDITNIVGGTITVETGTILQVGGPDNGGGPGNTTRTVNTIHNTGLITLDGTLLVNAQTPAGVQQGTLKLDSNSSTTHG